ncbi:hypothetical protein [Vibrio phage VH7D]|uniref:Uncharacterized protein n=2 Tax=Schizotequatrovirus TaxID=1198137 RepID=A0A126HGZ0_9CAUD|nr:hypothetical protein CF80_gp105 [Vibrio phage VH7D]AGB06892.1 hypothetical protein [Vibrio phage VH7D]ALP47135.1 hypothetical protein phiGrn1_0330 [Vibrio phage phi-Grn1]QBX06254.1 hypothetical protein Va3_301 [Vibrio phage Va3]QNJ54881.1 hypothetical protein vBValMR10Z_341 [Vibrio phage vB_ValM_R10Z]
MTIAQFQQDELYERSDFKVPEKPPIRKTRCKVTEEKEDKKILKIIMIWFFVTIAGIALSACFGLLSNKIEIGDRYYLLNDVGWERSQSVDFGIVVTDVNYNAERIRYKYIGLDALPEKEMSFTALKYSYVHEDSVDINTTTEKTK